MPHGNIREPLLFHGSCVQSQAQLVTHSSFRAASPAPAPPPQWSESDGLGRRRLPGGRAAAAEDCVAAVAVVAWNDKRSLVVRHISHCHSGSCFFDPVRRLRWRDDAQRVMSLLRPHRAAYEGRSPPRPTESCSRTLPAKKTSRLRESDGGMQMINDKSRINHRDEHQ